MDSHDIFLVFVGGAQGHEEAYAEWFAGTHMSDMAQLSGVVSARAYRLESLDGEAVPAQLCAIYETIDGPEILNTIAAAKGTDALPASDIQGKMIWRVLEGLEARDYGNEGHASSELICMFGGPYDEEADSRLLQHLCEHQGIGTIRQTRLSPAQPARGSEFGSILFVQIESACDPSLLTTDIARIRPTSELRFLLASPLG